MYKAKYKFYKYIGEGVYETEPFAELSKEVQTPGQAKQIEDLFWNLAIENDLDNQYVQVKGYIEDEDVLAEYEERIEAKQKAKLESVDEENADGDQIVAVEEEDEVAPLPEDYNFVLKANIAKDEEGNIDLLGSTLSVQCYGMEVDEEPENETEPGPEETTDDDEDGNDDSEDKNDESSDDDNADGGDTSIGDDEVVAPGGDDIETMSATTSSKKSKSKK